MPKSSICVVAHADDLVRPDGAVAVLQALGADVIPVEVWTEPAPETLADVQVQVIVFETLDRPDFAPLLLQQLRKVEGLSDCGTIVSVTAGQVGRMAAATAFDDFVMYPYVPAELYARIRRVEWRRSAFANEERIKLGAMVIERAAHRVSVDEVAIALTAKEFELLVYLCDHRGRAVTRDEVLARIWGSRYEGGARTVDIHVRRLRAKLGKALPLDTLRGVGYRLTP